MLGEICDTCYYCRSLWERMCVCVHKCVHEGVCMHVGGHLCVGWHSHGSTRGAPGPRTLFFFVVLLWPLVVRGLHDVIPSPWYAEVRMPTERTQRLHVCWGALFGNRRGSGEGRKKEDIPWISKKQRFNEVNCRLNLPRRTIGEEGATRRPGELAGVKSEVF